MKVQLQESKVVFAETSHRRTEFPRNPPRLTQFLEVIHLQLPQQEMQPPRLPLRLQIPLPAAKKGPQQLHPEIPRNSRTKSCGRQPGATEDVKSECLLWPQEKDSSLVCSTEPSPCATWWHPVLTSPKDTCHQLRARREPCLPLHLVQLEPPKPSRSNTDGFKHAETIHLTWHAFSPYPKKLSC